MGADTARSPQSTPARDSAWLLKAAHRMGLEGIVSKKLPRPHRSLFASRQLGAFTLIQSHFDPDRPWIVADA